MNISPKTIALVNKFNQHLLKKKKPPSSPIEVTENSGRQTDRQIRMEKGQELVRKAHS